MSVNRTLLAFNSNVTLHVMMQWE